MYMELRTGDVLCIVSQLYTVRAQLNFAVFLQGEVLFWLLMMYILMTFLSMDLIFVFMLIRKLNWISVQNFGKHFAIQAFVFWVSAFMIRPPLVLDKRNLNLLILFSSRAVSAFAGVLHSKYRLYCIEC